MCASSFSSAADWKLDEPAWSGRMKITAKGHLAFIKLEDKNTGKPTGISLQPNVTLLKQYIHIYIYIYLLILSERQIALQLTLLPLQVKWVWLFLSEPPAPLNFREDVISLARKQSGTASLCFKLPRNLWFLFGCSWNSWVLDVYCCRFTLDCTRIVSNKALNSVNTMTAAH